MLKWISLFALLTFANLSSAAIDYDMLASRIRSTLEKFVEADTSNPPGNESSVVKIAEQRLKSANIPYDIIEFAPGRQSIIARLKGNGAEKPMLLISHIDVVGTDGQKWTVPPHELTEKDGYLYGRGVYDDLGMGAVDLELLIYLKESGASLKRDVIVALTADEEIGGLGVPYILKNRRDLLDAEFAINEGGGIVLDSNGVPSFNTLQVAEKVYQDFEITARGTAGHSSVPLTDNAIYRISRALSRIGDYVRPARLLPATRAYYKSLSQLEKDPRRAKAMRDLADSTGPLPEDALKVLEENPNDAATLRTTCVTTMIKGGSGANSLPAEVVATVNCRMLPDESMADLKADLIKTINDPEIEVKGLYDYEPSPESPLTSPAAIAIDKVAKKLWPGLVTLPLLSNFCSDAIFLRGYGIPTYGFNPFPVNEEDLMRIHGADERIPIESLKIGARYTYELILELAEVQ